MIICVDVGNTNICLGVFEEDKLLKMFRFATNYNETSDELIVKVKSLFEINSIDYKKVEGAIIGSVVPRMDSILEKMFIDYFNIKPLFVGQGIKSGINIKIDNPKELGADLLVGAVGAVKKYGAPCLVIDMGTAITFVYINDKKEFQGGVICAGIKTSFSSLFANTSKLESTKISKPQSIIGKNTTNCVQNGMVYGTCGMIEGIVQRMREECGEFKTVLTGGEASLIQDYLREEVIIDNNLLFDGLLEIYKKNINK